MAAEVSDEQRQQVRTALREAGANEEIVGAFKDGDLNVLFSNGWDTKAFLLMAQQDLLLAKGLSAGAAGVIMVLKQGEPSFLTCLCSWEIFHAWRNSNLPNLGPFSRQSNDSHAYPSGQFIAMSHFLSFEPLIVPASMPLPLS
jgi:hypothetical protein